MNPARFSPEIRVGTRGSRLALAQAGEICARLRAKFPQKKFKLVVIQTAGDEFQSVEIFKKGGVGIFTKAIEKKLLKGAIDIAVHSLKDLPTTLPRGLVLGAFPKRRDPRDVLVSRRCLGLEELPEGSTVGTGSPRRKTQVLLARPDLFVADLRGNLDTRARRVLVEKKFDGMVVARAGLLRLKKYLKFARPISPEKVLPAPGQGALGIELRARDIQTARLVRVLNHSRTEKEVLAERSFLKTLGGGCRVPAGVHSQVRGNKIRLKAAVFSSRRAECVFSEASGPLDRSVEVGRKLAKDLIKKGARRLMREARSDER
ncbi:MAG: hydroxymethylbilane synthase [Candidatus Omnitrophica bacterium]|nr:hydroxymethylbilane synthase [Candidatus Omnitrophota bacterium]